jgi:replicative DNA helicase Mcm
MRDEIEFMKTGILIPNDRELINFFETYCADELYELANDYPTKKSFYINYNEVSTFSVGLAKAISSHFHDIREILAQAIIDSKPVNIHSDVEDIKKNLAIRICGVPSFLKQQIRDLGKKDVGKLICVDGFARSVSDTLPRDVRTAFECMRCGHITFVDQSVGNSLEEPFAGCSNETCGKKGPFKIDIELTEQIDYQRIQIQESPDSTRGTKTRDIIVECDEDLTNKIEPGDRVTVTGILLLKRQSGKDGKKNTHEKIIHAVSIEKTDLGFEDIIFSQEDEDEILELSRDPEIREKVCGSIVPSIYGYEVIKEAMALQLFSGVRKILPSDGVILRGDIHLILVGDPGIAKSLMLRRIARLSPRGVFTSGKTASAAGLTAAAVKDQLSDGWTLEGGAAVMASGGILCIDEIGQAKDEDKSALHEVMEQQTISISKAGIIATLKTECGVFAAGNPKTGYFDRNESYAEQVGLPPSLWSRFDLLFILLDNPDPEMDEAISSHVLRNHQIGGMIQNRDHAKTPMFTDDEIQEAISSIEPPVNETLLQKYVAYARAYIFPVASEEIWKTIQKLYKDIRRIKLVNPNNPVPITARSVEAIQRLCEASARMRLSNVISQDDVKFAVKVITASLKDVGMDPETGQLDAGMMYSGVSQSQKDKIQWVEEIFEKGASKEEFIQLMKSRHNIDAETALSLFEKVKKRSQIYQAGENLYRWTRSKN